MLLPTSAVKLPPCRVCVYPALANVDLPSGTEMPAKTPPVFLSFRSVKAETKNDASHGRGREYPIVTISDSFPSAIPRCMNPALTAPLSKDNGKLTDNVSRNFGGK